jgi:hypothetical protein
MFSFFPIFETFVAFGFGSADGCIRIQSGFGTHALKTSSLFLFFQLYDLLIMLVVALIGILIFRRIAITELQVYSFTAYHSIVQLVFGT